MIGPVGFIGWLVAGCNCSDDSEDIANRSIRHFELTMDVNTKGGSLVLMEGSLSSRWPRQSSISVEFMRLSR